MISIYRFFHINETYLHFERKLKAEVRIISLMWHYHFFFILQVKYMQLFKCVEKHPRVNVIWLVHLQILLGFK